MAELFLVKRSNAIFEKFFVIKRILPELAGDRVSRALFVNEARLHASISHPHVVELLDYGMDGNSLYMALEYVAGENLVARTQALRTLGSEERAKRALLAFEQMASALLYLHEHRQVIHQDLSPANILHSDNGYFKICDFGVSKRICASRLEAPQANGTFRYMPPEQVARAQTDQRSDLFSLAATLTEFYDGRKLYRDLDSDQLIKLIRNGDYLKYFKSLDLPQGLAQIILRAVQPSPQDRFQNAQELLDAVQRERARSLLHHTLQETEVDLPLDQKVLSKRSKVRVWSKLISLMLALPILLFIPWFAQWRSACERPR